MCLKGCPNKNSIYLFPLFAVPSGRAQHLLPEVCAVDAPRTLPGAPTARLFRERRRRRHEGNLRLHGWPVSCCLGYKLNTSAGGGGGGHRISMSSRCSKHNHHFSSVAQEVLQEVWTTGLAGGCDHSDWIPHRGQVWPPHHHAANPLLHHAVLVFRTHPHHLLDCVAVLFSVSVDLREQGGSGIRTAELSVGMLQHVIKLSYFPSWGLHHHPSLTGAQQSFLFCDGVFYGGFLVLISTYHHIFFCQ